MDELKFIRAALAALCLLAAPIILLNRTWPAYAGDDALATSDHSLFAQSATRILARDFPSEGLSYLLMDGQTGALLASRWPGAGNPIPLGSLVKPFAALAYAQQRQYQYPVFVCRGTASGCWQPRPHGRLNISAALAYSCNSYFRELTSRLTGGEIDGVAAQFGLDAPNPSLTGPALMGIGTQWQVSPLHMAHAYVELVRRRNEFGAREILEGLEDSGKWGTGSAAGRVLRSEDVLVKTGTAACRHTPHAPGDGFAVVIEPADEPDLLLGRYQFQTQTNCSYNSTNAWQLSICHRSARPH